MDESHREAQKLVEAVKAWHEVERAAQEKSVAEYEQAFEAFVSREVTSAGAVADLSDEQRGYIKGFALGLIVCGQLPSSSADRIVAPIFGDAFFGNSTTTVRISSQDGAGTAGRGTGTTSSLFAPVSPNDQ